MTTTPVSKSKLSCKEVKGKTDLKKETESINQCVTRTPSRENIRSNDKESDYSPIYFPLTQESNEEIDVLWDWHSPQSAQRKKRKQKRLVPVQSPKFPLKRYPSSNQNQNFERLQNELKALQEELAMPDDESCLCVSPQQEAEYKSGEGNSSNGEQGLQCDEFNDLFNDSLDEQFNLLSQQMEGEILENKSVVTEKKSNFSTSICSNSSVNDLINKYTKKETDKNDSNLTTNLFNETISNLPSKQVKPLPRTFSADSMQQGTKILQTTSGKLEFHRTKSFEMSALNGNNGIPKSILEEIERKRLEAKAKLESKKKKESVKSTQILCSQDEIEKKRLQALAKLQAKRLQDVVEKKRQEALKRLQINRLKNASQVKSTLTTRL